MVRRQHVQILLFPLPQQSNPTPIKDSIEPKNTAIPGYGGYIPSIKAENIHARGYSAIAKQSFQNERLGRNNFGLSTTGFNLKKEALIDNSKIASSSKYGKTEIQGAHPGWNVQARLYTGRLEIHNT